MKVKIVVFLYLLIILDASGQEAREKKKDTTMFAPYNLKWKIDIPITVIGYGTNYLGLKALRSKKAADTANVLKLTPEDVKIPFDRSAARQDPSHAKSANKIADISLIGCFLLPGVMLLNKRVRANGVKMIIMHMETQAIMANMYFLTMTISNRKRPYVYNVNEDPARRKRVGNNNSFYGGHASHAASCGFFIAKVMSDYYPERKLGRYLYPAAFIPPLIVGYFRYRAGQHFPSDLIVGTAVGATMGWLIPELHRPRKNKNKKRLDVGALFGPARGITLTYRL